MLDLDAYLARIEYAGPRRPSREVLSDVHLAHATHIPFENLDVLLGRGVRLDLETIQAKLVRSRRGGYCFEQNLLLAAALDVLGFSVTRLAARVRFGHHEVLSRTHMVLMVTIEGNRLLADVGFGGAGLLLPVPFVVGQTTRQFHWKYRVAEEPGQWVLAAHQGDGSWLDLYSFTLEPQLLVDYELANYYIATHPDSPFTKRLAVQLPTPEVRYNLRNRELIVDRGESVTTQALTDDDEILAVLNETFGLRFPPGTRFPYQDTE